MKHKLLIRQIKMYLGGLENTPPQWEGFLNAVDDAYQTDDEDYALLEHTMDVSAEEIFEKSKKIEWLSRLPDESPHPVLRISKEGQLLYFNPESLELLQLSNSDPAKPLPPEWQKLAHDAFDHYSNRTVELEFPERFFSITFSPVLEHNYVNVYGFDITERKLAENYLLDHNKVLGNLAAGKPLQENLDELSRKVEKYTDGLLSSILIQDKSGKFLHYGSAINLPPDYVNQTKEVPIGPHQGSCGTAAYQKKPLWWKIYPPIPFGINTNISLLLMA